jgi:hypothetical protein
MGFWSGPRKFLAAGLMRGSRGTDLSPLTHLDSAARIQFHQNAESAFCSTRDKCAAVQSFLISAKAFKGTTSKGRPERG